MVGRIENWRTNEDHLIKIVQNTEKSPRDLRRLAVTQTLMKYHQPMLL